MNINNRILYDNKGNIVLKKELFEQGFVYIYVLQLNRSDGRTTSQICIRKTEEEEIKFTIGKDGYYVLCRIIVSDTPNEGYYYANDSLYKGSEEIDLQEIINVNPEVSQLNIVFYQYFQMYKLKICYINLVKNILSSSCSIRCNSKYANQSDIYKRDLLWSAINTLEYLIEMGQYEEAEKLLERITDCNGICDNSETFNNNNCGCGN